MNQGQIVLSQIVSYLSKYEFNKCVTRYNGDHRVRSFTCWEQYLVMSFAQLTYRDSLRDIESCLGAMGKKLYHCGIRSQIPRSTLAEANENRDWRIYFDFASSLIEPYTYLWNSGSNSNTIYNTCANVDYQYTVTDVAGCAYSFHHKGIQPPRLKCTISNTMNNMNCDPNCNGSATANGVGGTTPYSFEWRDNENEHVSSDQVATGLCGGNYTVYVTDQNGCSASTTVPIVGSAPFQINADVGMSSCYCDGYVHLYPSSTSSSSFSYQLSTGSTMRAIYNLCGCRGDPVECPGTSFDVIVTDGAGCSQTESYQIENHASFLAIGCEVISNESFTGAGDGEIEASIWHGWSPFNLVWYDQYQNVVGNGWDLCGLNAGAYKVIATSSQGCTGSSTCIVETENNCDLGFTTFTQSEWANNGYATSVLNDDFEGCMDSIVIGDPCGYTILLTSVPAIKNFLPQGGAVTALTQNYVDPGAVAVSQLAGEVLAVGLALGIDNCDPIYCLSGVLLRDQIYINASSPFYGWTIQAIYDTARKVLSGCPSIYTLLLMNEACTDININYNEGTNEGLFTCLYDFNLLRMAQRPISITKQFLAYPNPFSGILNINVTTDEDLNVSVLEITGREVIVYRNINSSFAIDKQLDNGIYFIEVENISGSYRKSIKVICSK